MSAVLNWNGRDLPDDLRRLPPGRYVVEPIDRAPLLTPEEDEDLRTAIGEADAGEGISLDEARRRVLAR